MINQVSYNDTGQEHHQLVEQDEHADTKSDDRRRPLPHGYRDSLLKIELATATVAASRKSEFGTARGYLQSGIRYSVVRETQRYRTTEPQQADALTISWCQAVSLSRGGGAGSVASFSLPPRYRATVRIISAGGRSCPAPLGSPDFRSVSPGAAARSISSCIRTPYTSVIMRPGGARNLKIWKHIILTQGCHFNSTFI